MNTLAVRLTFPPVGHVRDFHPKARAHAGRTAPAVIVPLPPDNVRVDRISGVETVTVPVGTLINAIEQAINAAAEAGSTEATVEIRVEEEPSVSVVRVEIPVSDLRAVADSQVENVKIDTAVGEVTLNISALQDLIAEADARGAAVVEVAVERKASPEDGTLTEPQKEALKDDEKVREIYDVSVLINSAKLENFQTRPGKVIIGLPYGLRPSEVGERVLSVYVAEDGSRELMLDGRKYVRGMSVFNTSHLSVYAVTYETEEQAAPPVDDNDGDDNDGDDDGDDAVGGDQPSGGGGCDAGFGAAGLALLALVFKATRRRG
jgi:hypothetical protein